MSEPLVRPIVLDATVLSNFASTDSVTWLATTLEYLQTVPAVRTELENGREAGYTYLNHALAVLESGDIGVVETAPEQLQQDYPEIEDRLDPGEAEALVAAHTAGGTLVTDDGTARTLAADARGRKGFVGVRGRGVSLTHPCECATRADRQTTTDVRRSRRAGRHWPHRRNRVTSG